MFHWPTVIDHPGGLVVISDALASPGEFILHDIVVGCTKGQDKFCVLVSLNESIDHWKNIASRLSTTVNLANTVTNGRLAFIGNPVELEDKDVNYVHLHQLHSQIKSALESGCRHSDSGSMKSTVILDDITILHWMGVTAVELHRFLRALYGLCRKHGSTLVIRTHRISEHDELLKNTMQLCSLHIEVLALASGKSAAISGEIAIHRGPLYSDTETKSSSICRSRAVQYRLADAGAVYFERGTGAGVL